MPGLYILCQGSVQAIVRGAIFSCTHCCFSFISLELSHYDLWLDVKPQLHVKHFENSARAEFPNCFFVQRVDPVLDLS